MDNFEKMNILFHEILLLQDRLEKSKKEFKNQLDQSTQVNYYNARISKNLEKVEEISNTLEQHKKELKELFENIDISPVKKDLASFLDEKTMKMAAAVNLEIEENKKLLKEMNDGKETVKYLYRQIEKENEKMKDTVDLLKSEKKSMVILQSFLAGMIAAVILLRVGQNHGWF